MGKKGPLWWRESDWLLRGSSAANQILLRHSGPILSLSNKYYWQILSKANCVRVFMCVITYQISVSLTCLMCVVVIVAGLDVCLLDVVIVVVVAVAAVVGLEVCLVDVASAVVAVVVVHK